MESSPGLPPIEKARLQQRGPSVAKNKLKKKKRHRAGKNQSQNVPAPTSESFLLQVPGVQQQIREAGLHNPLPPPSGGVWPFELLGKCIFIGLGIWDTACPQGFDQLWAVP